jgi:GNAT superfamily N-acetyltransferase
MNSGGTVRVAGPGDVPALAALRRAWTEENAGRPVDDAGFEDAFASWFQREQEQRVTWLVEVDGRTVGMLNMLVFTRMPKPLSPEIPWSPRWGYVANVFVLVDLRGAGLGRLLVDAVTSYADEQGFARLVLARSERSVPLYTRAGFRPATSLMVREG